MLMTMTHSLRSFLRGWAGRVALATLAAVPLLAQQQSQSQPPPAVRQLPDYRLGPTDVIQVTVYGGGVLQTEFSQRPITVQNDGRVTLPYLGLIAVSQRTVREVEAEIRKGLIDQKVYDDPTVEVTVQSYRAYQVTVQGAVRSPGRVTMSAERMTLNEVINQVGGLATNAGTRIRIKGGPKRPTPDPDIRVEEGWEIYFKDDMVEGRLSDVRLYEDDTVQVEVAPKYYVNGQVKTPGEQQWEPNLTIQKALVRAGGPTDAAALNRVQIKRQDPKTKKYNNVKMDKDRMSMLVEPEDIIEVPKRRM